MQRPAPGRSSACLCPRLVRSWWYTQLGRAPPPPVQLSPLSSRQSSMSRLQGSSIAECSVGSVHRASAGSQATALPAAGPRAPKWQLHSSRRPRVPCKRRRQNTAGSSKIRCPQQARQAQQAQQAHRSSRVSLFVSSFPAASHVGHAVGRSGGAVSAGAGVAAMAPLLLPTIPGLHPSHSPSPRNRNPAHQSWPPPPWRRAGPLDVPAPPPAGAPQTPSPAPQSCLHVQRCGAGLWQHPGREGGRVGQQCRWACTAAPWASCRTSGRFYAAAVPCCCHGLPAPPAPLGSHPHPPFMISRVTVSRLSCPMRWLRPMACRSKLGLRVGSHRLPGGRGQMKEWSSRKKAVETSKPYREKPPPSKPSRAAGGRATLPASPRTRGLT